MTDLLTPLEPNAEDLLRPSGTLRGDVAALDAAARNVEVWVDARIGWRRLGAPLGSPVRTVLLMGGRGSIARGWDIGPVTFPKRKREEEDTDA